MNDKEIKIAERSEHIQNEMQAMIDNAKKIDPKSKAEYQDYVTAYLITRFAALEVTIEALLKEKGNVKF